MKHGAPLPLVIGTEGALRRSMSYDNSYLIIVIFFTLTQFLELKFYTEKMRKLRQNTQ